MVAGGDDVGPVGKDSLGPVAGDAPAALVGVFTVYDADIRSHPALEGGQLPAEMVQTVQSHHVADTENIHKKGPSFGVYGPFGAKSTKGEKAVSFKEKVLGLL